MTASANTLANTPAQLAPGGVNGRRSRGRPRGPVPNDIVRFLEDAVCGRMIAEGDPAQDMKRKHRRYPSAVERLDAARLLVRLKEYINLDNAARRASEAGADGVEPHATEELARRLAGLLQSHDLAGASSDGAPPSGAPAPAFYGNGGGGGPLPAAAPEGSLEQRAGAPAQISQNPSSRGPLQAGCVVTFSDVLRARCTEVEADGKRGFWIVEGLRGTEWQVLRRMPELTAEDVRELVPLHKREKGW